MQNIKELREQLAQNYAEMKAGTMSVGLGKELSNTAGKIINSVRVELEYNQLMKISKPIPFLESSDDSSKQ